MKRTKVKNTRPARKPKKHRGVGRVRVKGAFKVTIPFETVELGDTVRDVINGFEGIVIGKTAYLYGCNQLAVSPNKLAKDGSVLDAYWNDEQRFEVVSRPASKPMAIRPGLVSIPGGPQPVPRGVR